MTTTPVPLHSQTTATGPDLWVMTCPVCGGENIHLDAVAVSARLEDDPPDEIRVDAISGKIENHRGEEAPQVPVFGIGRRHRISLLGNCENGGHEFAVTFLQHKGETFVSASEEPNGTNRDNSPF